MEKMCNNGHELTKENQYLDKRSQRDGRKDRIRCYKCMQLSSKLSKQKDLRLLIRKKTLIEWSRERNAKQ